jgi:iron-sulfur cluster assembly protein
MITVTNKAIKELNRIKSLDPETSNANIRVKILGGGCSGMSYELGFDSQPPTANDKVILCGEVENPLIVLIDKKSSLFLSGTEIDFSDGLNGTGFVFANPNAKRTCGCGSSFSC